MKSILLKFLLAAAFLLIFGGELAEVHWEGVLVCFAAILLVPNGLKIIGFPKIWVQVVEFAAFLLLPAYCFLEVYSSRFLVLPYCISVIGITAVYTFDFLKKREFKSLTVWLPLFALGYLAVGVGWLFFFAFEVQPLGFDRVIVGLTAAHFHLAGFVLTLHIWQLMQQKTVRNKALLQIAPLLGMPLVATGITMTKIGFPFQIEMIGSLVFIVFVLVSIWELIRFALSQMGVQKALFLIAAGSLMFTMTLAACYAIRFVYPHSFFTIPNMKIWHGTINVFGFGLAALIGWGSMSRQTDEIH